MISVIVNNLFGVNIDSDKMIIILSIQDACFSQGIGLLNKVVEKEYLIDSFSDVYLQFI